jgi:hypothetical protein
MIKNLPERFVPKNYFYFDTSSINKIVDQLQEKDLAETQNLWAFKKRVICVSPINLYEIFQNKNIKRREHILYKLGILSYGKSAYFDTPTRILFGEVLGYLDNNLTDFEENIKNAWFDVKRDPKNITINIDPEDFAERRIIFRIFKKTIRFIFRNDLMQKDKGELFDLLEQDPDLIGVCVIKMISTRFSQDFSNKENQIKAFLVFLIFCFGVEPENSFLEKYWNNKENFNKENELIRTLNRMMSLLRDYNKELLFNNVFIQLMADYIIYEHTNTKKKIMESTLSDALHLVYSFYVMNFITDDSTILNFSKNKNLLNKRVLSVESNFYYISSFWQKILNIQLWFIQFFSYR